MTVSEHTWVPIAVKGAIARTLSHPVPFEFRLREDFAFRLRHRAAQYLGCREVFGEDASTPALVAQQAFLETTHSEQ